MRQKDYDKYKEMANIYLSLVWKKGLPEEEGLYWLYSYRYGKISCGNECKKELHLLEVHKDGVNNLMYMADGQFVWSSEIEDPMYMPLTLPELPNEQYYTGEIK